MHPWEIQPPQTIKTPSRVGAPGCGSDHSASAITEQRAARIHSQPRLFVCLCVCVCMEDLTPPTQQLFLLSQLVQLNTYWTDSIRIQGGEGPPTAGPDWPASRRRASASPRHWTAPLVRHHPRAPTDHSNGRLWEKMLLLCFQRGLRHYLHPCKRHAPPCSLRRAAASGGGAAQECVATFHISLGKKKHLFPIKRPLLM